MFMCKIAQENCKFSVIHVSDLIRDRRLLVIARVSRNAVGRVGFVCIQQTPTVFGSVNTQIHSSFSGTPDLLFHAFTVALMQRVRLSVVIWVDMDLS